MPTFVHSPTAPTTLSIPTVDPTKGVEDAFNEVIKHVHSWEGAQYHETLRSTYVALREYASNGTRRFGGASVDITQLEYLRVIAHLAQLREGGRVSEDVTEQVARVATRFNRRRTSTGNSTEPSAVIGEPRFESSVESPSSGGRSIEERVDLWTTGVPNVNDWRNVPVFSDSSMSSDESEPRRGRRESNVSVDIVRAVLATLPLASRTDHFAWEIGSEEGRPASRGSN
jgi:hypothetical protein